MADEQQIQNIFEQLRSGADLTAEQLKVLGVDALTTGDKIKNAGVKTAVALDKAGVSLSRGIAGFASGVAKGETSFKALNPVIDGVAGALGEMAKVLSFRVCPSSCAHCGIHSFACSMDKGWTI